MIWQSFRLRDKAMYPLRKVRAKKFSRKIRFRSENALLKTDKWAGISKVVPTFHYFRSEFSHLKRTFTNFYREFLVSYFPTQTDRQSFQIMDFFQCKKAWSAWSESDQSLIIAWSGTDQTPMKCPKNWSETDQFIGYLIRAWSDIFARVFFLVCDFLLKSRAGFKRAKHKTSP